ncbi:hypothetical protein AAG570_009164 [Ranatra chinensis]|uniref:Transposase n=1 Tax=Ranatra chinensis TaxID=642074 RepID=A0ABD0YSY7_9HEMI
MGLIGSFVLLGLLSGLVTAAPLEAEDFLSGVPPSPDISSVGVPPSPDISSVGVPPSPDISSVGVPPSPDVSSVDVPLSPDISSLGVPPSPDVSSVDVPLSPDISSVGVPPSPDTSSVGKRRPPPNASTKREENEPFLKIIITGDENWIIYQNMECKRSWEKRGDLPKKVMLSIWWDWRAVDFYELLTTNRTINWDVYCDQLDKLNAAIHQNHPELTNRKGIVFHHDNARPHTTLQTRQKLQERGWEVLPNPPYSPDLAPSDFHLFRSLQNSLNG